MKQDRLNPSGILVAVFLSAIVGTLLGRSVLQFLFMSPSLSNKTASNTAGALLTLALAYLVHDCYAHRDELVADVRQGSRLRGRGCRPSEATIAQPFGPGYEEDLLAFARPVRAFRTRLHLF